MNMMNINIRELISNKKAILQIGFLLTVCGVVIRWVSMKYIPEGAMTEPLSNTGLLVMYIGVILLCYYFIRFVSFTTSNKNSTVETNSTVTNTVNGNGNNQPKIFAKCPICGKEDYYTYYGVTDEYICVHCKSKFYKNNVITNAEGK